MLILRDSDSQMKVFVALTIVPNHNMVYWFVWKQAKRNISLMVKWREQQQKILFGNLVRNKNFSFIGDPIAAARNGQQWRHR